MLCLPGLTRNSRDFTHVAERIRRDRRVLCADLRGRGRSQHDPVWQNYHPGTYLADIGLLLNDAGVARCVLLGTSLGGILSLLLAAMNPSLVAGVILNDVGPEVAPEGLARKEHPARQPERAVERALESGLEPLDLDADAAGVLDDVGLFHPHPRRQHLIRLDYRPTSNQTLSAKYSSWSAIRIFG